MGLTFQKFAHDALMQEYPKSEYFRSAAQMVCIEGLRATVLMTMLIQCYNKIITHNKHIIIRSSIIEDIQSVYIIPGSSYERLFLVILVCDYVSL